MLRVHGPSGVLYLSMSGGVVLYRKVYSVQSSRCELNIDTMEPFSVNTDLGEAAWWLSLDNGHCPCNKDIRIGNESCRYAGRVSCTAVYTIQVCRTVSAIVPSEKTIEDPDEGNQNDAERTCAASSRVTFSFRVQVPQSALLRAPCCRVFQP
jgi:hypothetical protein